MDIDRIGGRTMLSLTCSLIPSVDLACNGIPRAEDLGIWRLRYNFILGFENL